MSDRAPQPVPKTSRRTFTRVVYGGTGLIYIGAWAYPVVQYLREAARIREDEALHDEAFLPEAQELPPGGSTMFRLGSEPCVLIHHADDSWTAFSAVCTHLNCVVAYQAEKQRFHCACHEGVFGARGENLSGPPGSPLPRYHVQVEAGGVRVRRSGGTSGDGNEV